MKQPRVDVALLPGQLVAVERSVCIVVDVLRASSTITTLLDRGCPEVVAAADVEEARRLGEALLAHLLCGEAGGLPPDGFAYGNSPSEFSRLDLAGNGVILATSNGTRVLSALSAEAPAVMVGSLLNRTAVARAALAIARERDLDVAVVCSAAHGGSRFVLEDALGAGAIVDAAITLDAEIQLTDAARFARGAFQSVADITSAVRSAYHSKELAEIGLDDDVTYCARLDTSNVAPVVRSVDGHLSISAY